MVRTLRSAATTGDGRPDRLQAARHETAEVIIRELGAGSRDMGLLPRLYTEGVEFRDSTAVIHGREALRKYYEEMNGILPSFDIVVTGRGERGGAYVVDWVATMQAGVGRLRTQPFESHGRTSFWFEPGGDRVCEQVDQYDLREVLRQFPDAARVVDRMERGFKGLPNALAAPLRVLDVAARVAVQFGRPQTFNRPRLGVVREGAEPSNVPHLTLLRNGCPFVDRRFPLVSGAVPSGLRAEVLWAGPGQFERGGERLANWMDGDGSILRLTIDQGKVRGSFQLLETPGRAADEAAGRFVRPRLSFMPGGPPWQNSPAYGVVNTGNTGVEWTSMGEARSLWEGGMPTGFHDGAGLTTTGQKVLAGMMPQDSVSAHYRVDASTGDTFHIGGNPARALLGGAGVDILRFRADGSLATRGRLKTESVVPPHDFLITDDYVLVIETKTSLDIPAVVTGAKSIVDAVHADPKSPPKLHVIHKETLEERAVVELPPFVGAHLTSARQEPDGGLSFVVTDSENPDPGLSAFRRMGQGSVEAHGGAVVRYDVDLDTRTARRRVLVGAERSAEWPMEDPRPENETLYFADQYSPEGRPGYFNGLIATHRDDGGVLDEYRLPPGVFIDEPQLVRDAHDPEKAWLVALTHDARSDSSQVMIFDADRLGGGPVAVLRSPEAVPIRAHGAARPLRDAEPPA
jgi:all-trans-8'-apo-beta-carotenal 15,15'-oxygenase